MNYYFSRVDLSYFLLKDRDRVIKQLGEGCFEVYLIDKSLFQYYLETRDISFILFPYVFIILFNLYENPIILDPINPDFPLLDIVFVYANSFLYVQKWLIIDTKKRVIKNINDTFDYILQRLDYWKQQDSENTYCSLEGYAYCSGKDCSLVDTHHCVLHHYLIAWDYFKEEIKKKREELIKEVETLFNKLLENTDQLFKIRLFWTFILVSFFAKFPFIALKEVDKKEEKRDLSKIDKALLIIVANRHKKKDIIKEKIKRKLRVSDNAVKLYLTKLKRKGYIYYDKDSDRIEVKELAYKRLNYLIERYKVNVYEYK